MAVARTKDSRISKTYALTLEDGQIVNVMACRGGQTVGSERALTQTQRELVIIQGRIEHLTQEAINAPDDKTYQSKLRYAQKFEKDFANLEPQIDKTLVAIMTEWDMALTEEEERAGVFVPITIEGLATIDRTIKFDVFNKLMEKFGEENEEKKESSASSPVGTAAKASSASAQAGTSTTSSQSNTD